jgi:hypothetical protein
MSDYWREIKAFLRREKIKFFSEKGHYDRFYYRFHYQVTISEESLSKFLEFKERGYFAAKKLVTFRWKVGDDYQYY